MPIDHERTQSKSRQANNLRTRHFERLVGRYPMMLHPIVPEATGLGEAARITHITSRDPWNLAERCDCRKHFLLMDAGYDITNILRQEGCNFERVLFLGETGYDDIDECCYIICRTKALVVRLYYSYYITLTRGKTRSSWNSARIHISSYYRYRS
jgi:hypothetical protein